MSSARPKRARAKLPPFWFRFSINGAISNEPGPQALVLAPTRELVVQVAEECMRLTPHKRCRAVSIIGGERFGGQLVDMKKGVNLVIGTPGRIIDHLSRGTLQLGRVRYVVLDEADRMLDIGFRPDIEKILRRCPGRATNVALVRHLAGAGAQAGAALYDQSAAHQFVAGQSDRREHSANVHYRRTTLEIRFAAGSDSPRKAPAVHHFLRTEKLGPKCL